MIKLLFVAITYTLALTPLLAESPQKSPNVLFIAIDDLRPELATYGAKTITPNMDRLAETGVRFDHAYCQQAVCGASRLSIMGGLYPTMTGEQTFHVSGWRTRHPNLLTMNQHFGAQGYQTIGLGKIYHGHSGPGVDTPNWDRWIDLKAAQYALPESIEALQRALAEGKIGDESDSAKGPLTESADVDDDTYLDGKRATQAVEILKQQAEKNGKPFFFAVGLEKPHLPFVAPQKYWDLYERDDFAMPSNKSIPPGYPTFAANLMAGELSKYSDFEGKGPVDFSDELNRRLLHGYAAATSYTDACIGRILDALDQTGLAKNTIVVLWGDHGYKLGDHSTWVKHTNFECDTRVPLIVRDPRLPAGKPTSRLVELIDLYPTLCDLTGIKIPAHCHGRSFRQLLSDPNAGHRMDAYSSYPARKLMGHSLRFQNYRYTEWRDETGAVPAKVLTDLKADPGEVTNVIDDPQYAEALARGVERLELRIQRSLKEKKQPSASRTSSHLDSSNRDTQARDEAEVDPSLAGSRPNVIFFLADDQSQFDYSAYGNASVPTPTTDAFAKEALVFDRAFTGQAICAPSRSMLYTGLYPIRNGCFINHTAIRPGVKTLPTYLQNLGYDVILAGKSHVQPNEQFPWTHGFHPVNKPDAPRPWIPIEKIGGYLETADKPFCMMVASEYPHVPYFKKTPFAPADVKLPSFTRDTEANRKNAARYYASIAEKEREFARLLALIDKNGLANNTVVFYASDHGSARGKFTVYDSGLKVPLLVRWPRKIKPGRSDALISFADFLPTVVELAGGSAPSDLDGLSLLPVLEGNADKHHDYVYGVAHNQGIQNRHVFPQRSVHDGRFHFIYNFNSLERLGREQANGAEIDYFLRRGAEKHRTQPEEELYDTLQDPDELINLAKQTDANEIKTHLRKQLFQWMESQKDYLSENGPVVLLKTKRHSLDQPEAEFNYDVPKQHVGSLKELLRDPHKITAQ